MHEDEKELITMKQLQQEFGIKSRATVHKYMREGMPYVKKLGRNYFNQGDVKKWLDRYRMGDPEYIDMMSQAQKKFPGQYLEQIEYIRKHGTDKQYAFALAEVGQYVFSSNLVAREGEITLQGAHLDFFLRGLLHAFPDVSNEKFVLISRRIDSLIKTAIEQGEWKQYKKIKCNFFEFMQEQTMKEYEDKLFKPEEEIEKDFWEGRLSDRP